MARRRAQRLDSLTVQGADLPDATDTAATIGDLLARVPEDDVRAFYADRLADVCDRHTDPVRAAHAALWLHRTLCAGPPLYDATMPGLLALADPAMPWPDP